MRLEDASGISGTGRIAEGVRFSTGECVLNWLTAHRSQAIYADVETLHAIHGHGGATVLVWDDTDLIFGGHRLAPLIGRWGESKCVGCDYVWVEPDNVWYRLGTAPRGQEESVKPPPRCPALGPVLS